MTDEAISTLEDEIDVLHKKLSLACEECSYFLDEELLLEKYPSMSKKLDHCPSEMMALADARVANLEREIAEKEKEINEILSKLETEGEK